ncbi:MAG: hypothetical protein JW952_00030 [Candidatus Eisenbacteria bacterium]|nr:hypothetical protein [Candidatus Eisenbacteria bacterium]
MTRRSSTGSAFSGGPVVRCCAGERGNALVIALLVLLVLSSMAAIFVGVTKTEKQISGNNLRDSQSLYIAEAGVAEALSRMSAPASPSYIGETTTPPTPGWGRYVVQSGTASTSDPEHAATQYDGLDNDGNGQVDEAGEAYPEIYSSQISLQDPLGYPWVKVRYRQMDVGGVQRVVLFGDHDNNLATRPVMNTAHGHPVLIVTCNGRQSNATKTVEVEALRLPGPTVPGSVYTEGTLECKGTSFLIDGNDYDPVTGTIVTGSTPLPGVVPTQGTSAVDCNTPQGWNNIQGEGTAPSIVPATVDIDLAAVFDIYEAMADISYNGTQMNPNTSSWGTADDYKIVCIRNGELHLSGANSGGGILLVEGDMTISGQFTWYGLIICLANVEFTGGGAGIHIYGGVMTQGDISSSGSVSGNADILYSSATISKLTEFQTYRVCSWRER